MAGNSPGCIIHFDGKYGETKKLTRETLSKIMERRKQWLELPSAYKQFSEVAKRCYEIFNDEANIEEVLDQAFYFHIGCYRNFTDKCKLERANKIIANPSKNKNCAEAEEEEPIKKKSTRSTTFQALRSISSPRSAHVLPKFCLICKKDGPIFITDKRTKKRIRQDLSLTQTLTAGILKEVATTKGDESVLIHIRDKDCVALEARYHKRCYQRYTKCLPNKPSDIGPSLYDRAFDQFCIETIETRLLENQEILLLSFLLKTFKECIQKIDNVVDISYQAARLKVRIQKRYPQIVFHPSRTMTKGTLVYADSIAAGDVADNLIDADDEEYEEEDDSESEYCVPDAVQDKNCSLQNLFLAALEVKKLIGECEGIGSIWPPDSHDLTMSSAYTSIPTKLFNFLCWAIGYSQEPSIDEKVSVTDDERAKVLSIAQDLVYAESKGRKQTEKSLALGMAVRQITGSNRLLKIIHGLGHCVSPSTVYKHDSALSLASTMESDITIPRNINQGTFITIIWDNNDFREETASGKGTTHVANGIIIQEGDTTYRKKATVSKKIRTVRAPEKIISPYTCKTRASPSLQSLEEPISEKSHSRVQDEAKRIDLAYIVAKMTDKENSYCLPGWTGFNVILTEEVRDVTKIGYLPVLDAPVTEMATVNTLLINSNSIAERLQLSEIVLVFDEALYAKAQLVRWNRAAFQQRFVIRLGDFHTTMSFCTAIAKIYKDAGLQDIMIESDVVAVGSVNGVLTGKHYNRSIRAHKLIFEAMRKLQIQAFLESLSENDPYRLDFSPFGYKLLESIEKKSFYETCQNNEFKKFQDEFQKFIDERCEQSPTFALWSNYIEMVQLLLLFIRATRTSDWKLHLSTLRSMIPWFFATDRVNYARYAPCYWLEMTQLDKTHPYVAENICDNWTVQRQNRYGFARVACDMTIEQTINRDSKMKGGLVGMTLNRGAMHRWITAQAERAAITRECEIMANVSSNKRKRKDLDKTRATSDRKAVNEIVQTIEAMVNPFSHNDEALIHLSSGVVAIAKIKSDMKSMYEKGESAAVEFMENQSLCDKPDIYNPIKKTNLQTFTSLSKTVTTKKKNGEIVALKNSKLLFARMILLAKSRNLDMQDVLCYSLRPYPNSLATTEGKLIKTVKSKLLTTIEAEVSDCHVETIADEKAFIIDGMAVIQMLPNTANTFREFARNLLVKVIDTASVSDAGRVDFVCDRYPAQSIKDLERDKRAGGNSQTIQIYSEHQKVPRQWKKFLSSGHNKEELQKFLFTTWKTLEGRLLRNIELFVTHENYCHRLIAVNNEIVSTSIEELRCDHEEADTRLILHAKHASHTYSNVIIKSPDTDVFVIAMNSTLNLSCNLFFETGTGRLKRILSLNKVRQSIGDIWCSSLMGLHAFTGCDTVSAFYGKGKTTVLKTARKSSEYAVIFGLLGTAIPPSQELKIGLHKFVCHLYGYKDIHTVNEVRFKLFKDGKCDEELLPPNTDSPDQHIERANYQCYIWRHADLAELNLPSFLQHGWKLDSDDSVLVDWMKLAPAPDSLLEFISCKCRKGCENNRCSCKKATLTCTDLCKCSGCKNVKCAEDEENDLDSYYSEYDISCIDESEEEA